MKRKKNHVWIIEMRARASRRFAATVGCKLTRSDALRELREWRDNNPDDYFRIQKYTGP